MQQDFWKERYTNNSTGWDIGSASTPIINYFEKIEDKSVRILIPGCGFGHEASYLFTKGFKNVYILDFVEDALIKFQENNPIFPSENIIYSDFFTFQVEEINKFDIVIEQTLFCAIERSNRPKYVEKIKQILAKEGLLIGVLFNSEFPVDHVGPPHGGNKEEYLNLFEKEFNNISIEHCYNSIKPRKDKEFFIQISN